MDPENIESIFNWPNPRNVIDVRYFMGLAGYYRRFIEEFSKCYREKFPMAWGVPQQTE